MGFYSKEAIKNIQSELNLFKTDNTSLVLIIKLINTITKNCTTSDDLYKFAYYGILRRINIMKQCVDNIFEIHPFYSEDLLKKKELFDLTINLQCFLFHLYGTLENLAWVYAIQIDFEKDRRKRTFFANKNKKNTAPTLLETLPKHIQDAFIGDGAWIDYVREIRNALAHQEPFYIPPNAVNDKNKDEWCILEAEKKEIENTYIMQLFHQFVKRQTLSRPQSIKEIQNDSKEQDEFEQQRNKKIERIEKEQEKYMTFQPVIITNTSTPSINALQFYPRVLADMKTLYEKVILILQYVVTLQQEKTA